ncbi:MAG: autotransporter assembly complex protein TamA [Oceanococcus sp.]
MLRRRLLLLLALVISPVLHAGVKIQGLNSTQEENVRAFLSLERLKADARREAVYRRYRSANQEIRQALQALGFYSPRIQKSINVEDDGDWVVNFDIDPGPRTTIQSQTILYTGPGAELLEKTKPPIDLSGQPLHHDQYRKLKDQLLGDSFALGFLQSELTQAQLLIEPKQSRADINLTLDSGKRFFFGDIVIRQDILADEFIRRYVDIVEGQPFDADALLNLQLRLSDLDYFQSLEVRTEQRDQDQRVDVDIETTPKKPQRYQFGLGYGTDTGPRVSVATEFRHLNQQGHRVRSDLRVAETQQNWSAQYLIPTGRQIGSNIALSVAFNAEAFGDARSDNWVWQLGRSFVDKSRLWQGYLRYELESFRIGDETREQTELLMPGLSLNLRHADDDLNPRKGYRIFADVHAAHQNLVSSDSFTQVLLQTRWILPLPWRSRVLMRAQSGTNFVGKVSEMPLSQRFFAGGDQTVRGYGYQTLGPTDQDGDVIGGKYLNVLSLELDSIIYDDYGLAVFYDYGGAGDQAWKNLYAGAGLGFRWRTGIGMVRADFAWPIDKPDDGMRVHIGIGAEL